MMLPTDMALTKDKSFKKFAQQYAKSEEVFFKEYVHGAWHQGELR
jgi:cytochrome c peroxidase